MQNPEDSWVSNPVCTTDYLQKTYTLSSNLIGERLLSMYYNVLNGILIIAYLFTTYWLLLYLSSHVIMRRNSRLEPVIPHTVWFEEINQIKKEVSGNSCLTVFIHSINGGPAHRHLPERLLRGRWYVIPALTWEIKEILMSHLTISVPVLFCFSTSK